MEKPMPIPFAEAIGYWLKLGFVSFGAPAGQISMMHQELVERRRWISEQRFLHALNYCMVLPGPEAQQLATYIGWLMHGVKGGIAAAVVWVILNHARIFAWHVLWPAGIAAPFSLVHLITGMDWISLVIGLMAFVALFRYKFSIMHVIAACALAGLLMTFVR